MKGNLGISVVLSAVILTSVLCVIVFSASNVANDAVNGQIENAQFEQAKNVILALDMMIKRIIYKPESSGRVRTSFWTTTPYFTKTGENMSVTVWSGGKKEIEVTIPVNIVRIRGGERASVTTDRDLIGNGSLLLADICASLGRVRVYQSAGAWIALDYSRVRCTDAGVMRYYNGTGYESYNFVEITVVNIIFGDFRIEEQASFVVRNKGLFPIQKEISRGSNPTIIVRKSGVEESRTLAEIGGNPDYGALINLVVINIEISIVAGD